MTAKNVFVAGTDILASAVNENFNTVPYVMESGSISVTGTQAITFTAGRFSVAPNVFLTVNSNTGTASSATITGLTSSGGTIAVWNGGVASTVARTVYWTAIQMKSGAANG